MHKKQHRLITDSTKSYRHDSQTLRHFTRIDGESRTLMVDSDWLILGQVLNCIVTWGQYGYKRVHTDVMDNLIGPKYYSELVG